MTLLSANVVVQTKQI